MTRCGNDAPTANIRGQVKSLGAALGQSLSDGQVDQLAGHLALIAKWNRVYNLTAVREPAAMLTQHLADCLAATAAVTRHVGGGQLRILDVGSGAGLPGAVLAVCLPEARVTCIDAVGKKAAFVQQVALELSVTNLQARHGRIEALREGPFDLVVSRAFAALPAFTAVTRRLLADAGAWAAMKGLRPDEEIGALPADIDVFHVEQLSVPSLDAERCMVWMRLRR